MPPKVIARNADRQGGVLPVSAAARAAPAKAPAPRLKLEVRRLPPGLTLSEFEEILGDEWKLGNGRVDWREYRQGKTRSPGSGKVPDQSRCYIHVTEERYVRDFEKRFLEVVFHDKAGTHRNPDLKHLAPYVGFAPNQRTPLQQSKRRIDTRQGTIDQDPEFIAFLEAETQPIVKPSSVDAVNVEKEGEKLDIKTTPLIEDLREKKANKAKAAQAKAEKAEKDKKAANDASKGPAAAKDAEKSAQQQKIEAAVKEAGKVAMKQAAAKQAQQAQQAKVNSPSKARKPPPSPKLSNTAATQAAPSSTPTGPAPQRLPPSQRPRGSAEGIKKMLQKDLGIRPKPAPASQVSPASGPSATQAASPMSPPSGPANTSTAPPRAPAPKAAPATTTPVKSPAEVKPQIPKAYLKHANPSQGMTEMLIQQALAQYGETTNVAIDPRKGTAIAFFKDNGGLKRALEAKRVPVANGAVEVLEFRDRASSGPANRGTFRGGRGRGGARGGAQGGPAQSPAPAPAAGQTVS